MRRLIPGLIALVLVAPARATAEIKTLETGAFEVVCTVTLPGSPEEVYDAITGDISGWWDHSMSGHPLRYVLEAKPGGHFLEVFDESGDGVIHATVTYAHRGKLLRFVGPLGLAGNALDLVTTYTFEPDGDNGTKLTVTSRGAGQMQEGWPNAVDRVWQHFIVEQFKPWYEAGNHKKRSGAGGMAR